MNKSLIVYVTQKDENRLILDTKYRIEELTNLLENLDYSIEDVVYQDSKQMNPTSLIGIGKIEEIKTLIDIREINTVVFYNHLTPAQFNNLQEALKVKVMDRDMVILEIFSQRARTAQSKAEIKLAQLIYQLPRLKGLNSSLDRQGGSGSAFSKGSGETQSELDKRKITTEIENLQKKINQVKESRTLTKDKRNRNELMIVALVGYTNSGKSTTFETLMKLSKNYSSSVQGENKLFATLDTTVKQVKLPNFFPFLLVDTVGFVTDLPSQLINSFMSTLEEIKSANLIIHVLDSSLEGYYLEQLNVTLDILNRLDIKAEDEIFLMNKADIAQQQTFENPNSIIYSNKTKQGLEELVDKIKDILSKDLPLNIDFIPYSKQNVAQVIEQYSYIMSRVTDDLGTTYTYKIPKKYENLVNIEKKKSA